MTSDGGAASAADADDRTIQQAPTGEASTLPEATAALAEPPVTPIHPRLPSRPPPLPPRALRAPRPAESEPVTTPKAPLPDVEVEDSITATAPRTSMPKLPAPLPRSVEIRTIEGDEDEDPIDETEVKTLAAAPPVPDESITAEAPLGKRPPSSHDDAVGVIRISPKSLMPAAGDAYEEDESVTTRGPVVDDYQDDSVTTQAPALLPAIDGETEGTTKKVRKHAADDEAESITSKAPGHLTNMLRVIAADKSAPIEDDEDPIQAHTQVMANAPLKPTDLGSALAPRLEPTSESESGLRVARPHASVGVAPEPPPLDVPTVFPFGAQHAELERRPPYGLIVAVVAAISVVVPVLVFVALSQSAGEQYVPRVARAPSPDPVSRADAPRPRAGKTATKRGRR